jgi:all-trans-8'-apo-beta-carotenal 15,15'-oxygenase
MSASAVVSAAGGAAKAAPGAPGGDAPGQPATDALDPSAPIDFAPGLERAFSSIPEERSYRVREVRGSLPAWLRGTCYWNGPARFERGGQRYGHWLDGDGMVAALRFDDDGAHFTNRFVRSAKWVAEEEAGCALFRTFGTGFAGDRLAPRGLALESPVNVSVIPFGAPPGAAPGTAPGGSGCAALLACGEQGLPWELDPVTLETRRPFTFSGALNPVSPFAAHVKIDPVSGELWNFGLSYSHHQPALHLYRFSPGGALLARRRVPLDLPVSMHDFLLAPRHAVFHVSPYRLDMEALAAGSNLHKALRWEPASRGSELIIVARGDLARHGADQQVVLRVPVGAGYCLHGIGAGEDAAGRLVLDWLELDRPVYDEYQDLPDLFRTIGPGRPVRLVVDPDRGELVERLTLDYELAPDFPVVAPRSDGRPYDDFWMLGVSAAGRAGRKFYDQLVHGDWRRPGAVPAVWQAPPGYYLAGEAALAPHPDGGRGGALICPLFDGTTGESGFLIFDAGDITAGPRAELRLEAPIPPAFHAAYAPAPAA